MSALTPRELSGTCWRRACWRSSAPPTAVSCCCCCCRLWFNNNNSTCWRRTAQPTAVSEHLSDSKDVNNCLELSTRGCILIFNDNFALAKSFPKTRTDAHTRRLLQFRSRLQRMEPNSVGWRLEIACRPEGPRGPSPARIFKGCQGGLIWPGRLILPDQHGVGRQARVELCSPALFQANNTFAARRILHTCIVALRAQKAGDMAG